MSDEVNPEDIIRILVATDNHLGYAEKDSVRGDDSFRAFEELLQMAVSENVDFILLGGDLFHDAVPSQNALHKCVKLLRRYTFGEKPIELEFLSDQKVNFETAVNKTVNYEDPNLNISIPVFSIHGNHDDPSGFGNLSSLDILSTTGLVNYFGRWRDLTNIQINPILLRKGQTQLAMYGLSHIHDGRLARLFENHKVTTLVPSAEEGEWFNLMVVHQNRADRGPKNYLPEDVLPDFLNLIIWGHEHDCRLEPEYNPKKNFYVSQPGSSVPTSLSEGEAIKKYVGLLEIYKTKFQMKPLPLQTVRPFVFESANLLEFMEELGLDEGNAGAKVQAFATQRVEDMIKRAENMHTGNAEQPKLPLIRLRLIFSEEEQMFNAIRFGQTFNKRVANPVDMIHFKKLAKKTKQTGVTFDKDILLPPPNTPIEEETRIEDLISRFFENVDTTRAPELVSSKVLAEMCFRMVERSDTNAAENIIKFYKEKAVSYLMETLPPKEEISEKLSNFRDQIKPENISALLDARGSNSEVQVKIKKQPSKKLDKSATSPTKGVQKPAPAAKRGRGRGRAVETKTTHKMPQLDVSVRSRRSTTQQPSLIDAINARSPGRRRRAVVPTYEISDSDS